MADGQGNESGEATEADESTNAGSSGGGEGGSADPVEGLKTALASERTLHKQAREQAKEAQREAEKLRRDKVGEIEQAKADAKAEARKEVLQEVQSRLLEASIKAHAAGKLRKPEYALRLIDKASLVNEDGEVVDKKVAEAIDALLKEDPALGVDEKRPLGGGSPRPGTPGSGKTVDDRIRNALRR